MNRVLKRYPVAKFREDLKRIVARLELIGGAAILTNHGSDGPVLIPLDLISTDDEDEAVNGFLLLRQQYEKLKKLEDPKGEEEIDLDDARSARPTTGVRVIGGKSTEAKRGRRHG